MSHVYRGTDCLNIAFCSKEDKANLAGRAAAMDAIDSKHLRYVHNELARKFKFAKVERCEAKKKEILSDYLFEMNRRSLCGQKKVCLSDEQLNQLKTAFLANCNDIVVAIIVQSALNCRIQNGYCSHGLLPEYVKKTAKELYGIEIRS